MTRKKVWIYSEQEAPSLADFQAGGDRRRSFVKYWVSDNIGNAGDLLMHYGLKLLTPDMCARAGARLGRFAIARWHPVARKRAQATVARLCPEASAEEQARIVAANAENQGRFLTEFSMIERIARGRNRVLTRPGTDVVALAKDGPVIFIGLHLGNWEVMWRHLINLNIPVTTNYVPPKGRARHWIANRVRTKGGLGILPPGKTYVRPALRLLESGGNLLIFCDEGMNGRIRGPFLGRPAHLDGNLALVARFARRCGATICPVYTVRTAGARFAFHALLPIVLQAGPASEAQLLEDVILLNGVIEPVIRAHLDQWYFLDSAL